MALTPAQARAHLLSVMARVVAAVGSENFVDGGQTRRKPAGKKRPEVAAVNRYQTTLESDYRDWADGLAAQLADDPDNSDEIIAAALLALLLLLRRRGAENLPDAVTLALSRAGLPAPTTAILQRLADAIARNDEYLTNSLLPAIGERLREMLASGEWLLAVGGGAAEIGRLVPELLLAFASRVGAYASEWWRLAQETAGLAAQEKGIKIYWELDEQAQHCPDCLAYGNKLYGGWDELLGETGGITPANGTECGPNCRCMLLVDGYEDAA